MITRSALIHKMSMSMAAEALEHRDKPLDMDKMAAVALQAVMDEVAGPLCQILEGAPFGAIAADKIKELAGR